MKYFQLLFFVFSLLILCVYAQLSPIVNLPGQGALQGSITNGAWTNKQIYQYLGVKYAEAPNGNLRYKAPVEALPWSGTRDVTQHGRDCPSLRVLRDLGVGQITPEVEDCLTLCAYSSDLNARKPVMVYIHGGGFLDGASNMHPPQYLLERDIVLVVPQYRLGPLGFLATNTDTIPGNAALLDVKLALEWVQKYITYFGGDPTKVTVFGQSAGAAIVSSLTLSPSVGDYLFNKVILQSGSSMGSWVWDNNPEVNARDIARLGNCDHTADLATVENCLMNMNALVLMTAFTTHIIMGSFNGVDTVGGHRMTIGGPTNFLPTNPYQIMRAGGGRANLKMMAGVTKHDGSFAFANVYDILLNTVGVTDANYNSFKMIDTFNQILGVDDPTGTLTGFATKTLFTQNQLKSGNFNSMLNGFTDLSSVSMIKGPTMRAAQANARVNPGQTFLYTFDYIGEFTRFGYGADTSHYPFKGGVHHSDDNIYLFPWPENVANLNAADTIMAQKMVDLWTSFAINGVPASSNVPSWPSMTDVSGPYLHINSASTIGTDFIDEYSVAVRENLNSNYKQEFMQRVRAARAPYFNTKQDVPDLMKTKIHNN